MREVGLIPELFNMWGGIVLRRLLRRGSTTEVFNRGLYREVVEANNQWIKKERGMGGLGVKHDCELYSGVKRLGDIPEYLQNL